jgi:tetratricopeptide (TPR) repeat protein
MVNLRMFSRIPFLAGALLIGASAIAHASDEDQCAVGSGEGAVAACSEIITETKGPDVAWAYFNRGRAYFNAKMYGSAIADLTDVLRFKPDDADAVENRGLAFLAMADYGRALSDFDKAIALRPTWASGYRGRCSARAAANRDLDDAVRDCNMALSLQAGDAGAFDARCLVWVRKAIYRAAIADCKAALNINPMLASSLYLLGVAKIRTGDLAHGDADISTARAMDPDVISIFVMYGIKP